MAGKRRSPGKLAKPQCPKYGSGACDKPSNAAYVRVGDKSTLFLCPLFFTMDHNAGEQQIGGHSQVGTVLHEYAHYAGARDIAYGYQPALNLAKSNPTSAMANADNYRLFWMRGP